MSGAVSELFLAVCDWAIAKGATDLANKPGLWTETLGEFAISLNAHSEEVETADGMRVPPITAFINAPKYLASFILVGPCGGIGAPGMEDDVLAALKADIESMKDPTP